MVRVLAFAGSTRTDSFNRKILTAAIRGAEAAGGKVTRVELRDFSMPLFDEDLQRSIGLPEKALQLQQIFRNHDALLIASPEYNSSYTPLLKNTLDWVSRPASSGDKPLVAFTGKTAGLISASPGALGGLRGLVHVRAILGNLGVLVIPEQAAVMAAHEALHADGSIKDEKQRGAVEAIGRKLVETTAKLLK